MTRRILISPRPRVITPRDFSRGNARLQSGGSNVSYPNESREGEGNGDRRSRDLSSGTRETSEDAVRSRSSLTRRQWRRSVAVRATRRSKEEREAVRYLHGEAQLPVLIFRRDFPVCGAFERSTVTPRKIREKENAGARVARVFGLTRDQGLC